VILGLRAKKSVIRPIAMLFNGADGHKSSTGTTLGLIGDIINV
jgi:hypothetical protein